MNDHATRSVRTAAGNLMAVPGSASNFSFGRFLRACAGVDEKLMRQVWPVRHAYSGLGGIVLGTAVAAATSMTLAIALTVDGFAWYMLVGPLLWGLLVFNLDRWLVSSTHGANRQWKLIPRLAIAVLFGFIIAEPVVLWVFNDAIEERLIDDRAAEVDEGITLLKTCNPEDDPALAIEQRTRAECDGWIVSRVIPAAELFETEDREGGAASGEAAVLQEAKARLEAELKVVGERIATLEAARDDARLQLQLEISGEAASGRIGDGPRAAAIRERVETLEADIGEPLDRRAQIERELEEAEKGLAQFAAATRIESEELERELQGREQERIGRLAAYSADTEEAIALRITELRQRNGSQIGLLQRFDALSDLASDHRHIWVARWLLTLLLVAVDSMPVVAKAIGGKSAYDNVFREAIGVEVASYRSWARAARDERVKDLEVERFEASLSRSVKRRRATQQATSDVFDIDDELQQLYHEHGVSWERPDMEFSPHGALVTRRPRKRIGNGPGVHLHRASAVDDGGGVSVIDDPDPVAIEDTRRAEPAPGVSPTDEDVGGSDWLDRFEATNR